MRMMAAAALGLLATTGLAGASSVVRPGAASSTPSVVRIGAIDPAKGAATPSVIAIGEPAVTDEKVAAIPEKSERTRTPMIIRGGVVGGAFATPAATAAAAKTTTPAATAPANGTTTGQTTPPNGTTAAAPNSDTKAAGNKPTATATAANGQEQPQVQSKNALPRPSKAM